MLFGPAQFLSRLWYSRHSSLYSGSGVDYTCGWSSIRGLLVCTPVITPRRGGGVSICEGSAACTFSAIPELVLHEYCHVVKQWEPRRLTIWRYLVESLRRGYWQESASNFEAREFAKMHRGQLDTLLSQEHH